MFKEIKKCRVCGSPNLELVFDLGIQSLTGVFPKRKNQKITQGPIQLVRCSGQNTCGLVQLKQSYDMEEMYGLNYGYRSGLNASMVSHLHSKVHKILRSNLLSDGDLIIDIGSNDGTTLRSYPPGHFKLIGVDPTGVKFAHYYPSDISLISDFFSGEIIKRNFGSIKARVITSFSMFYDLEDPITFAKEVESVLDDNGVWVLEQSYLPSMLKNNSFDTICHEHLEFYGLKQIIWIVEEAGLCVKDLEFNEINGGSFSIEVVKKGSKHLLNKNKIEQVLKNEQSLGLEDGSAFIDFRKQITEEKEKLLNLLGKLKKDNKKVVGLGASTKGNVLLQYCEIGPDLLSCIAEVNKDKFGCYTPNTLIPLVDEKTVLKSNPDYFLVLPWHFKPYFLNSKKLAGHKLIFPLPKLEVLDVPSK